VYKKARLLKGSNQGNTTEFLLRLFSGRHFVLNKVYRWLNKLQAIYRLRRSLVRPSGSDIKQNGDQKTDVKQILLCSLAQTDKTRSIKLNHSFLIVFFLSAR